MEIQKKCKSKRQSSRRVSSLWEWQGNDHIILWKGTSTWDMQPKELWNLNRMVFIKSQSQRHTPIPPVNPFNWRHLESRIYCENCQGKMTCRAYPSEKEKKSLTEVWDEIRSIQWEKGKSDHRTCGNIGCLIFDAKLIDSR